MNTKKSLGAYLIIGLIVIGLIAYTTPQTKANPQFVLASWAYPDENGQGIDRIDLYENSTGTWADTGLDADWDGSEIIDWNASLFIKLSVWTYFNSSFMGIADDVVGRNYQKHNVTVTRLGETIFSQQNFTYVVVETFLTPPVWHYCYEVILNFLPIAGQIYTVTVTYEVYY